MTEVGVTEDLVEKGAKAIGAHYNDDPEWYRRDLASAVLAAVVPEVRRQVAGEIAAANEEAADDLHLPFMGYSESLGWFRDLLHAQAAKAREIGGGDQ